MPLYVNDMWVYKYEESLESHVALNLFHEILNNEWILAAFGNLTAFGNLKKNFGDKKTIPSFAGKMAQFET